MVRREPGMLKEVRFSMNAKAIVIGLLLIATAGMTGLGTPAARAATPINDQLVQETGPTTALGGGGPVFPPFGTRGALGRGYRAARDPKNISIVSDQESALRVG